MNLTILSIATYILLCFLHFLKKDQLVYFSRRKKNYHHFMNVYCLE